VLVAKLDLKLRAVSIAASLDAFVVVEMPEDWYLAQAKSLRRSFLLNLRSSGRSFLLNLRSSGRSFTRQGPNWEDIAASKGSAEEF